MLHIMMVAQRVDNYKIKCESLFAFPAKLEVDEEERERNDEQEQHDVNRRSDGRDGFTPSLL
jgi:hypothetical protein